jgi:hypothetical protein
MGILKYHQTSLISYERGWLLACLDGLINPNQASRWYDLRLAIGRTNWSASGWLPCPLHVDTNDRVCVDGNSKKHSFLIYYFANIVLLKLLTVRKQWRTEICASLFSVGWQFLLRDGPVHVQYRQNPALGVLGCRREMNYSSRALM